MYVCACVAAEKFKTNGVSLEDFGLTNKRVENLEMSIATIVSRIDSVLQKMEAMEKAKAARREALDKLLRAIVAGEQQAAGGGEDAAAGGGEDAAAGTSGDPEVAKRRAQLKSLVAEELEELDDIRKTSSSGSRPVTAAPKQPSADARRPPTAGSVRPPTAGNVRPPTAGARPPTAGRPAW